MKIPRCPSAAALCPNVAGVKFGSGGIGAESGKITVEQWLDQFREPVGRLARSGTAFYTSRLRCLAVSEVQRLGVRVAELDALRLACRFLLLSGEQGMPMPESIDLPRFAAIDSMSDHC